MVVDIMCRSYFQTARTKLNINISIFYNWNFTTNEWHDDMLPLEPCILYIGRVNTHCSVTHNSFRTGGCNDSIVSFVVFVHHISFFHLLAIGFYYAVFQIVKFGMFILIDYFFIRKCSLCFGIPVDHTHATINQSLFIEIAEHLDNPFASGLIHCKCCAIPIA